MTKGEIIKNNMSVKDEGIRDTILSKGIDFSRRNSYSDLSKSPLNSKYQIW